MKKNQSSRSGLLLMEIIIAILFFSVVSAVCLQLFVKAHNLSKDTGELDMAVREASSIAELISQSGRPLEKIQEIYQDADMEEDGGSIYFDERFTACKSETANYRLDIVSDKTSGKTVVYNIVISTADEKKEIYRLETMTYQPHIPEKTNSRQ